jgi:TRAP transporter TAXI family solute receptor
MSGIRRRSFLALPACLLVPTFVDAQTQPATRVADRPLVLATSTPGGGFSLYGDMLARVLNQRAGRKLLQTQLTRGTTENLELLQKGTIDAALIQGTSASELFQPGSTNGLRILYAMYPSPGMLAVPASSSIRRLEDVLGKPVVFGVKTSGLVTLGRQVYAGIGVDIDRDTKAIYVEQAAESPKIVLAGNAVGLWGAGEGWPGFTTLAQSAGGARFIGPSVDQIPKITAQYPLLKAMEVAVGAYPGIDQPLQTVGSVNLIVCRADLDDALAARFVHAMHEAAPDLGAALSQASFSTLANTLASAPSAESLHRVVQMEK